MGGDTSFQSNRSKDTGAGSGSSTIRELGFDGFDFCRSFWANCLKEGLSYDSSDRGPLQRQDYREGRAFSQRAGHIDASLVVLYDATGQGQS